VFNPITIPADSVMLMNVVKLKPEVTVEDVELVMGEMCNVVKNNYGDETGGFIAGQVFQSAGFVSEEGSFDAQKPAEEQLVIVTYWKSFQQHEQSHADDLFREKFGALADYCEDTYEVGYRLLWQGEPE